MIDEIRDIWNFDPISWIEIKSYIIPVTVIICIAMMFWIMSMHGHVVDISNSPISFSSGHPSYGDPSIFGSDGYHFRNE
jgi:hypothetical protein